MKRRTLLFSLPAFLLATKATGSFGQSQEQVEQYYSNATRRVVRTVREKVRPFLTEAEKKIESKINAKVVSSANFNAFARINGGQREIIFTTAFVLFADSLARAYVADSEFGASGCFKEYAEYFLHGLIDNTKRAQQGLGPKPRAYFDLYILDSSGTCSSLSSQALISDSRYGTMIAGIMDATLAVITLHEIAHHVLGHVDRGNVSLAESRKMERDADIWAFAHSLKIRINPLAAEPTWMLFSAMDGADLAGEARSTHPLGLRRYLELLQAVEQSASTSDYEKTFGAKMPPPMMQEIKSAIRRIRGQLN